MKKHWLFSGLIVLVAVLLFLLRFTKMPAHIAISVEGLVLMVVYTVLTKKEWKLPVVEIFCRACYLIALISGVLLMNVQGVAAMSVIHKVSAALFTATFVFLFLHKIVKK